MRAAEAVLAAEYDDFKAEILRTVAAKLAASGAGSGSLDLDLAYNEAWHALYLKLEQGEAVANHKGFLVTVAYRRALSEYRAARLEHVASAEELEAVPVEADIDARLDAEMQLRQFVQGLRARLSRRELEAATLCHLHGLSRPEAAKAIGIAPRRMEKLMDQASKTIGSVIGEVKPGRLCEGFDSLIRAYAVGMLDPDGERYRLARDHLEDCPACRRKVLSLRGLAAIGPPVPILLAALGGGGAAAGGAAAAKSAGGAASAGRKGWLAGHTTAIAAGAAGVAVAAVVALAAVAALGGGDSGGGGGSTAPAAIGAPARSAGGGAGPRAAGERHAAPHPAPPGERQASAPAAEAAAEAPEPEPVEAPVEAAPEPVEAPAAETAPPPEPAPAEPPSAPPAESEPRPKAPITDAGVEFELR